jgi:hypothetical protein
MQKVVLKLLTEGTIGGRQAGRDLAPAHAPLGQGNTKKHTGKTPEQVVE